MPEELKFEMPSPGWRQFLTARQGMLDAFDRAREKARAHEVETYHGAVAESEFRNWLSNFLPKRYGVTSGYIVSLGLRSTEKVPHFDVIVYDQLESPVLWIEDHPDVSSQGRSLAIPVEHVRAVLEIKSTLTAASADAAAEHLGDLSRLLGGPYDPTKSYPLYLSPKFCCGMVFFDLRLESQFSEAAINRIISCAQYRGFFGALILRGEGHNELEAGRIDLRHDETPDRFPKEWLAEIADVKRSLLWNWVEPFKIAEKSYIYLSLWTEQVFAEFAFELIERMDGNYRPGYPHNLYALGASRFEKPPKP